MRETNDRQWMHATCAFWHPEIKYMNMDPQQSARSHLFAHADRFTLTYVCAVLDECSRS